MARTTATGAWHLSAQYAYKLDKGLVQALVPYVQNKTVVDIGAGKGRYVMSLQARGADVHGLEGADNIADVRLTPLVQHADLTEKLNPCAQYDWALFLEIGEHIPRSFESTVFQNINCSTRDKVVISWAHPGQWGNGHVNCRPPSHITRRMYEHGFHLESTIGAALRNSSQLPWFQRNILVFGR